MNDSKTLEAIERKLTALLILTNYYNTAEAERMGKLEVALDNAGIDRQEIALIVGKNKAAVDKVIQRSKK